MMGNKLWSGLAGISWATATMYGLAQTSIEIPAHAIVLLWTIVFLFAAYISLTCWLVEDIHKILKKQQEGA